MTGRRSIPAVALAALFLGGAGAAHADFDQAMGYFKAGKFLEAAAEFQGMVDAAPTYDYGQYMLGQCQLRVGRAADAERSFRKAIEMRGDKAEYVHGLAVAFKDQRRYVMALGVLSNEERLVRDRRTAYAFLALRGYLFAALRRWGEATGDLERALALKRDPILLDLLGKAYFSMGRYDRAAAAFSSASDATPADARPCRMLSESLLRIAAASQDPTRKREIYTQAMAAAQRLMRIQPGDPEAVGLLGRAALGAGRFSAAESAFNSVLSVHPGACHVLIDLSRALLGLDRAGDAEAALDGASRCASSMAEVPEGLGRVYFRQMRFDKALDAFLRANSLQPSAAARAGIEAVRAEIEARRDGPARKDRASRPVGPSR